MVRCAYLVSVLGATFVLGAVPSAWAQEPQGRTVAILKRPSPVAGYGDSLAWSSFVDGRFRLTVWNAATGKVSMPRIPAKGIPFDVDLGPDQHGRPTAVYSRCQSEPYAGGGSRGGTGCDIYRLDLAGGREHAVRVAATKKYREFLPTIWRDRITFARLPQGWRTYDDPAEIRTAKLNAGHAARLAGSTPETGVGPTRLDSYGQRITVQWPTRPEKCTGPDAQSATNSGSETWMARIGSTRQTRINRHCDEDVPPGIAVDRPTIGSRGIVGISRTPAAGGQYDYTDGIGAAKISQPAAFRTFAQVACVTDVAQFRSGIAALTADNPSCDQAQGPLTLRLLP